MLPSVTVGALQRSGFSDEDCDCRTHCWSRQGDSLHERVTSNRTFSELLAMMYVRCTEINHFVEIMIELCHGQRLPDLERMAQPLLQSFSRLETSCVTGEETASQNVNGLHTGMAQRRSLVCNTSRCGWHLEQRQFSAARVMFDTPQHQSKCHLFRCSMLSVHRWYCMVVTCKSPRIWSWTSTRHR